MARRCCAGVHTGMIGFVKDLDPQPTPTLDHNTGSVLLSHCSLASTFVGDLGREAAET